MRAAAVACANVALVKYWGKRGSPELNLPAVGSLSVTLAALTTTTSVEFTNAPSDRFILNGAPAPLDRVGPHLDRVRARAGVSQRAVVTSTNDFPTGAGLASSASGFAALTLAACRAAGLTLTAAELSGLARRGSGSAARSIFGGFVEMRRGEAADGSDAVAEPLAPAEHWPLSVVVAITTSAAKAVGSTTGMEQSRSASPFWSSWVAGQPIDLEEARRAVAARDFAKLAAVTERSCLKMHAVALAGGLLYWRPATLAAIERVRELAAAGVPVCFTVDAGPQVKAVCLPEAGERVATALRDVPGVERVLVSGLGAGARLLP